MKINGQKNEYQSPFHHEINRIPVQMVMVIKISGEHGHGKQHPYLQKFFLGRHVLQIRESGHGK